MKYTITFSCGHDGELDLSGNESERERKIAWYENQGLCPECYKAKKEEERKNTCIEVEMAYSEYKNNWSHCFKKPNSYNADKKTVVVFVPKEEWNKD